MLIAQHRLTAGCGAVGAIFVFAFWGGIPVLPAAEPPSAANAPANPSHWTPVTSHHRTFVVTDMPRRDALEVAVWAESVREKLENWAGRHVPREQVYPMIISAELRPSEPMGGITSAQDLTPDGKLRQELNLINPARMDQEDALEGLCGLLLHRWLPARSSRRIPDWFAVGVAQNLYPELHDRNLDVWRQSERLGSARAFNAVFDQTAFSPGRWPEKAQAGLVVSFMAEAIGPAALFQAVLDHVAAGRAFDGAAALQLMPVTTARELNIAWDLWLIRQERRIIPGVMSGDPEALARILEMRGEDIGLVFPGSLPEGRLNVEILVVAREQVWVRDIARIITWRLGQEMIGKTPELVGLIRPFLAFFDALPLAETKKSRARAASNRDLQKQWESATRAFNAYILRYRARRDLLDAFSPPEQIPTGFKEWLNAVESRHIP